MMKERQNGEEKLKAIMGAWRERKQMEREGDFVLYFGK